MVKNPFLEAKKGYATVSPVLEIATLKYMVLQKLDFTTLSTVKLHLAPQALS